MTKAKLLIAFNIVLCILFFVFHYFEFEILSLITRFLIICVFTSLYFMKGKYKSKYFSIFLLLFTFSEFLSIFSNWLPPLVDYISGNLLYILAYIFLLFEITKDLKFKELCRKFSIQLVVLTILNIYLIYYLTTILSPVAYGYEIVIELTYNIVILLVLSISLIYYLQNDTKRSLILFFGSLCIVSSEVLQIAYFYIIETKVLGLLYTALLFLAFYFYYLQSIIVKESVKVIV